MGVWIGEKVHHSFNPFFCKVGRLSGYKNTDGGPEEGLAVCDRLKRINGYLKKGKLFESNCVYNWDKRKKYIDFNDAFIQCAQILFFWFKDIAKRT